MKKSTVAELLGCRIRLLRRAKGLTQKELAVKCDLHSKFIREVEKGKEDPTLEDLAKISKALEAELVDLVREKHEEEDPSKIRTEILEIIDQIEKEDKEKLQLVLEILQALK